MTAPTGQDGALSRDARRKLVRQLSDQRLSARAIAAQLNVGKDTVRRDLEWLSQNPAPAKAEGAPPGAAVATETLAAEPAGATDCDNRLTIELDEQLRADLATIALTGLSEEDAVRLAVAFVAHGYRWAWDTGLYPRGVAPTHMSMRVPPRPQPSPGRAER